MRIAQRHRERAVPEQLLDLLQRSAPAMTSQDAQVCRRSWNLNPATFAGPHRRARRRCGPPREGQSHRPPLCEHWALRLRAAQGRQNVVHARAIHRDLAPAAGLRLLHEQGRRGRSRCAPTSDPGSRPDACPCLQRDRHDGVQTRALRVAAETSSRRRGPSASERKRSRPSGSRARRIRGSLST